MGNGWPLHARSCVNGTPDSPFGQFAYCNAPAVFSAAKRAVSAGQLNIPAAGTATKAGGQACPAGTRDFRIVDMDQSDNVVTTYLLIGGKILAQNTPANSAANKDAEELTNGSDNALVNDILQPIMGCSTLQAPSLTAPNGVSAGLILNVGDGSSDAPFSILLTSKQGTCWRISPSQPCCFSSPVSVLLLKHAFWIGSLG